MSIWLSIQNSSKLKDTFHSTKTARLIFQNFTVPNGTTFFGKEHNLRRYNHIFENFSPRVSVPFEFAPEISRIFRWMVRPGNSVNFPNHCPHHLPPFQTLIRNFWSNRKRPTLNVGIQVPNKGLKYRILHLSCVHGLDLVGSKFWKQRRTRWLVRLLIFSYEPIITKLMTYP